MIDLLRSPLDIALGDHSHIRKSDSVVTGTHITTDKQDGPSNVQNETVGSTTSITYQKLGDFTLLWNYLNKDSIPSPKQLDLSAKPISKNHVANPVILKSTGEKYTILSHKRVDNGASKHIPARLVSTDQVYTSLDDPSRSSTTTESEDETQIFDFPTRDSSALAFIPSQVRLPTNHSSTLITPLSSCDELESAINAGPSRYAGGTPPVPITKSLYKNSVDRKASLMTKLLQRYPEYALHNLTHKRGLAPSSKLHIFIDSSNIMIGFHDCVKLARNLPITSRLPRLPFSFHNFSLILERGRPAAKRVLAGSDRFPAINEAEKIGYEVNILNRVHKAKYFTPRQMKFRNPTINPFQSGYFSDLDSGRLPGERWVEQGVDEILHLKMLESLVDSEEPATIVLATGDAAEAEYSGGFKKMVERALEKGWSVELVSFELNTSHAYKRKEFRSKWTSQFSMTHLDDYIEELLGI